MAGITEKLRQYAGAPWFPVLVGILSGVNLFTLVLSTPLVVLYCSAVLANEKMWLRTAVCNAVGTVAGVVVLCSLVDVHGTGFIRETFPTTFESRWWAWTEHMMQTYGAVAAVPVAAMPIILHPLVFFAKLSGMSPAVLYTSILVGRILKYSIMAHMAMSAPQLLKYFGASKEVIAEVSQGGDKKDS
mmetsp:Transcript_59621/g.141870  ORF Transcript_59621/g.141870 Transcript_59621/m.141870 type:complete len:187 (+) Transcript_59621:124-684(+)